MTLKMEKVPDTKYKFKLTPTEFVMNMIVFGKSLSFCYRNRTKQSYFMGMWRIPPLKYEKTLNMDLCKCLISFIKGEFCLLME